MDAKMAQIDPTNLAERLRWEQQDYWLHVESDSSLEKYPAKQHARRVVEKLGVSEGLIYLPGEPQRNNEDSDMPAPFRQRRYFYYLSGCNEPSCQLTYDIQNDSLVLFIPRINPERVIWNGRGSTKAEAMDKYDIDLVKYVDELQDFLDDWAKYYRGIFYLLHPSQSPWLDFPKEVDTTSLQLAINLARLIKDDHEIKRIRKANDISSKAHRKVLASIKKFKNEAQVEGLFLDVCISGGAREQAYGVIAASGPNAGTLHYDANNEDFEDRQLICLDAGCEWDLYASDITRTFPLSGEWPSKEAKDIYSLVQKMQESCIDKLAPGVRYLDLHIQAHQIAIEGLLKLGILHNGTSEEIYKAGTSRAFFPHGLGHHVGLEVHDPGQADLMSMTRGNPTYVQAPSLFPKDFHLPVYDLTTCRSPVDVQSGHLEEGMVVTVEPGIYFSSYALNMFYLPHPVHSKYINTKVVARYLPIGGVRIEDDILITSNGYENLTTAPKAEVMLEIIRSGNSQWPFVSGSTDLGPVKESKVQRKPVQENDEPLLRAPGLPKDVKMPITRAQTLPTRAPNDHGVPDFKTCELPSLFSGFRRASTVDDTARPAAAPKLQGPHRIPRVPVCGQKTKEFLHAFLDFAPQEPNELLEPYSFHPDPIAPKKPTCRKCAILVQTVERLRANLIKSEQDTAKRQAASVATVWPADMMNPPLKSLNDQKPSDRTSQIRLSEDEIEAARKAQRPYNTELINPSKDTPPKRTFSNRKDRPVSLPTRSRTITLPADPIPSAAAKSDSLPTRTVLPLRPNPALAQRFTDRFAALRQQQHDRVGNFASRPSLPELRSQPRHEPELHSHCAGGALHCNIPQELEPCWPGPSRAPPPPPESRPEPQPPRPRACPNTQNLSSFDLKLPPTPFPRISKAFVSQTRSKPSAPHPRPVTSALHLRQNPQSASRPSKPCVICSQGLFIGKTCQYCGYYTPTPATQTQPPPSPLREYTQQVKKWHCTRCEARVPTPSEDGEGMCKECEEYVAWQASRPKPKEKPLVPKPTEQPLAVERPPRFSVTTLPNAIDYFRDEEVNARLNEQMYGGGVKLGWNLKDIQKERLEKDKQEGSLEKDVQKAMDMLWSIKQQLQMQGPECGEKRLCGDEGREGAGRE
ncbi:hypothetical protein BCR34DRAFT_105189 [Clohesyomyces aquaticus]|uniref:Xaa-Pro aminopeptidase n=1 Tax=Clohesyomyces aquaticus TaxID=1231657 RepID=A0A1Y2A1R6_9PLEO|nr:hypothetical protein BCR34DRAFT_105189 [Clohesyomyces aquaticus]